MIKDAALSGVAQGIRTTQFANIFGVGGSNESFNGIDYNTTALDDNPVSDTLSTFSVEDAIYNPITTKKLHQRQKKFDPSIIQYDSTDNYVYFDDDNSSDQYYIDIPSWGYVDYINERNIWLKHLSNGLDEQNWLYFRIFFNFDSRHGLLGGILNSDTQHDEHSINSAIKYLNYLHPDYYKVENIEARKKSLKKFAKTLSAINTLSPWVFKSISGLNNATNPNINDFSKEKSFNIELNPDTIDFRLTTMLSAYKYACFDDIGTKEIIPENLRKFDMTVVMFSVPIKYIHTPVVNDTTGKVLRKQYKRGYHASDMNNVMSMKVLSFYNCEFDASTIGNYIPNSLTSDSPFQLGKFSLKVNYDKVLETTINEYDQLLINSMGIWDYNKKSGGTLELLAETRDSMARGDVLLSASDAYITYKLTETFGNGKNFVLGNIFGQDAKIYKSALGKTYDKNAQSSLNDYFKAKVKALKGEKNLLLDVGYNILYRLLGMSYRYGEAPGNDGTGTVLNGQGQLGVGSLVFKEKMDRLKNGGFNSLSAREERLNAINRADNFSIGKFIQNNINRK